MNATQIALVVSLLPVAAMADIVGYRHVYRFGLVLFSLASIGCAFAPSLRWLLLGRTFQGLGGAAIMSVQPALVRAIYPRNMLGRGLGFNTTVVATSLAAGPSIGAALLSITSWPILFAVYAPLGIISFALSERFLPHTTHIHRPFDVISAILSGLTFGLLIFGIDGMAHGHQRPVIATELILAVVLGTLFVWRQKKLADPMMPIDVFKRPIFSLSITAAMCTFSAQGLAFVSLPFYFHTVLGRSATDTGILLTAWPLALAGVAPIAGRLADRHHAGVLGAIGLTFMTTGPGADGAAAGRSLERQHHVAAGAVRRGLRHLRLAQQPADDERRAARAKRQRRRHHRHRPHPGPDRGRRTGRAGVQPVRLLQWRRRRCRARRPLAGRGLRRHGAGGGEPPAPPLGAGGTLVAATLVAGERYPAMKVRVPAGPWCTPWKGAGSHTPQHCSGPSRRRAIQ